MLHFLRSLFSGSASFESNIGRLNQRRGELAKLQDDELKAAGERAHDLLEIIAVTAVVAARVLGLVMFDVQLRGAQALANGTIAEMQTGEGKTLAAVPAIVGYAKEGQGVHVMTVNDYLARRDAKWMGPIYEFLGLSVGCIQQGMGVEDRQRAYACDITYATANEVGFDYLRDQLALHPCELVHRTFGVAVIDEADSLLIDEARVPLVIAGGESDQVQLAHRVDRLVRNFRRSFHFTLDEFERNIALTDAGIQAVERAFNCGNLFAEENFQLLVAVQNSLHAHALLRRDVDYLVKDGAIKSIDEFKGRIVQERRWPGDLQTAIEVKESVAPKAQGRILGSITMQNLVALYPKVCGMTGTAATQAEEFRTIYGLEVEVIPTNRPMIRVDHPDVLFRTKQEKERAVVEEIRHVHQTGRPILVGTVSVEESERLSASLGDIPHQVLNARDEEKEAGIIAHAGELGAVTISTNMAGRGTDIRLGRGVAELGGLYVIGTNRHESRRIDNQLRGRAGRQGNPGSSRFYVSLQDELLVKYGIDKTGLRHDPESIQRLVEGQNLDIRQFLHKYESVIEGQRQAIQGRREAILRGSIPCSSELERLVSLTTIDELWSEHLAVAAELREGTQWVSYGGREPLYEYLRTVHRLFENLQTRIAEEIPKRLKEAATQNLDPSRRGATWTYFTTERPFGSLGERLAAGLIRKARTRRFWG
ncbi:MAG TPA: DEAD/DEAH box helicase [Terriglobia bacterium]|nr:DEAD/DEAH box helicase [Terriglobia bacterium]